MRPLAKLLVLGLAGFFGKLWELVRQLDEASWPAIRDWARRNPQRVNEMLWSNPRVVFFREEPLPDPTVGPRGAMGVALTPGRSVAVDPLAVPYGTPLWLDTTEPLSSTPLRRLVMAQDTGSAITGAVRADYFWGWGGDAEAPAGTIKVDLISGNAAARWDVYFDDQVICTTPCSKWIDPSRPLLFRTRDEGIYGRGADKVRVEHLMPWASTGMVQVAAMPTAQGQFATGIVFTSFGGRIS